MTEDDEKTTLSRVPAATPDDLDDATQLSRPAAELPNDETTVSQRGGDVDDETTVSRRDASPAPAPDLDDATRVSSRSQADDEATRVSRSSAPVDDATVVRRDPIDDSTALVDRSTPRAKPRVNGPGRISGGRVAFVPASETVRYDVRAKLQTPDVVRTVIPAPAPSSPTRQSRDTAGITVATHSRRRRGGVGMLFAVAGAVLFAVVVAAAVLWFLLFS